MSEEHGIWWAHPESKMLPMSEGPRLSDAEVMALTKDPNPVIQKLACEVAAHRWCVSEEAQGGD